MDPAAAVGGAFNIISYIVKAHDLYSDCKKAPEEIQLACEHIQTLILLLESVKSDLIVNPRSFVHQSTHIAKARTQSLKLYMAHCDTALERMKRLLKKYHGFQHVKGWDKYKWSMEGKKEISEAKSDLIMSIISLEMFMTKEGLSVLWKVEKTMEMLEVLMKNLYGSEMLRASRTTNGKAKQPKASNPGVKRLKLVTSASPGFRVNKKRDSLVHSYAGTIASASGRASPKLQRPQTPDPNSGGAKSKLLSTEHLECWKVGIGSLAIGLRTAPKFVQHRRGQIQLREMAAAFKEASQYDSMGLHEQDSRIKLLLKAKNDKEKKNRTGRRWCLVAARVISRDPGKTRMITVEKAIAILARRE